jgi:hypothetical protein
MTLNSNDSPSSTLTFAHRFSPTVQCCVRVVDRPPEPGATLNLTFQWSGRPKRKHLGEYRRWILSTAQTLADRWEARILYALGVAANSTELWTFEPGKAPQLVQKLNVGIP